jgi:hypothetical protein
MSVVPRARQTSLPPHGASYIALRGKTPAHMLAVVKMMGDTSV